MKDSKYIWPIKPKYKVAEHDKWGIRKNHYVLFKERAHSGFDITADIGTEGELRMVYSILGEDERTGTNEYYKEETVNEPIVEVTDEAIIGKISFQMEDETAITTDDIKLKTGSTSPTTGIKVVTSS